jgi:nicotinamidase-related amidase
MLPRTNKQLHTDIEPQTGDIFIGKSKPSAFFGTMLVPYLVDLNADSLLVCGSTTSGCVRATVVDGFSYNYRMAVVKECTFDRFESSHAVNLFDMHMKYADVVAFDETLEYVRSLEEGLFDEQMPSLRYPNLATR